MKVATWNVNGIRARHGQFLEWLETTRPDVVCLQEIKASLAQVPAQICDLNGYWCYWHGAGGYSGVGLHLRRGSVSQKPGVSPPPFATATRGLPAPARAPPFSSVYGP